MAQRVASQFKMSLLEAALDRNVNPSPVKKRSALEDIEVDVLKEVMNWLSERMRGVLHTSDWDNISGM